MAIIHPLKIGDVQLNNNVILAPMAGVSDLPFRVLCSEMGVGMTCTEMISAKAIMYNNKKTYELMRMDEREPVVSLQLFGSEPLCIANMAKRLEDEGIGYDILDINMGCPVPKVVNNNEGSALMKNLPLAGRIVEETVKATKKPVTVKIRIGFDAEHINAPEMAHVLEESGASAVAVHGRTRTQQYSGQANWDVIGEVKSRVNIPVIGNGDLSCYNDLCKMYDKAKVDGFMIGRAARGNPWLFRGILAESEKCGDRLDSCDGETGGAAVDLCDGQTGGADDTFTRGRVSDKSDISALALDGKEYKPSWEEIKEMMLRHAKMIIDYKGEYIGIREMRKHSAWYTAGFPGSVAFRGNINKVESLEEFRHLLEEY